jgi:hypothetical protein
MTPRGACGLAVQLPIQFVTCASAAWQAIENADTIAAATMIVLRIAFMMCSLGRI